MSQPEIDPETMAALVDGTLAPAERARVMALIASSDELREAWLDTIAVAEELRRTPGSDRPLGPARRPPRRRLLFLAPMAVAAILLVVLFRRPDSAVWRLASELGDAATVVSPRVTIGPDWALGRWTATRGEGTSVAPPARLFRLGAGVVRYEVAVQAADTTAARQVAADLHELAGDLPGGSAAAALYAGGATVSGSARDRVAAVERLAGGHPAFALGAAAEAARLHLALGGGGAAGAGSPARSGGWRNRRDRSARSLPRSPDDWRTRWRAAATSPERVGSATPCWRSGAGREPDGQRRHQGSIVRDRGSRDGRLTDGGHQDRPGGLERRGARVGGAVGDSGGHHQSQHLPIVVVFRLMMAPGPVGPENGQVASGVEVVPRRWAGSGTNHVGHGHGNLRSSRRWGRRHPRRGWRLRHLR